MTTKEFGKIIRTIESAYPGKFKLDENQIEVWFSMLGQYDAREMYFGVRDYILSHAFPPAISDIKEATQPYFGASRNKA